MFKRNWTIFVPQRCQAWKSGAKTIKKNTNSTQNESETHRAKQYEVTSFLSTDCELSTETCSKNVYSLGPRSNLNANYEFAVLFVLVACILVRYISISWSWYFWTWVKPMFSYAGELIWRPIDSEVSTTMYTRLVHKVTFLSVLICCAFRRQPVMFSCVLVTLAMFLSRWIQARYRLANLTHASSYHLSSTVWLS